jgi:2-deoxy-scyllo-inosamine dehydrogenase (SAM-dependent)
MSDEVFVATVRQLAEASFAGRISYHLYNEPLLRRDLARLVEVVDRLLPEALQLVNTNGDLLDDTRYAELRRAGVDYFYVTRHEPGPFPERPFQIVQDSDGLTLTNRGGTLAHLPPPSAEATRTPCWAPSEMLIVTVTGDVLLCYEDARREHVLGNVLASSLPEIWNDETAVALRGRLQAGDRTASSLCRACSNVSHPEAGRSALEDAVLAATRIGRSADAVATLKQRSRAAREGFRVSHLFSEGLHRQVAHEGEGEIEAVRIVTAADLVGGCNFIDYVELPPGTSVGDHEHALDEEEFYLVLSGSGVMRLGDDCFPVGPGDLVRNPPGGLHGLVNTGPSTLKLFVFELSVRGGKG